MHNGDSSRALESMPATKPEPAGASFPNGRVLDLSAMRMFGVIRRCKQLKLAAAVQTVRFLAAGAFSMPEGGQPLRSERPMCRTRPEQKSPGRETEAVARCTLSPLPPSPALPTSTIPLPGAFPSRRSPLWSGLLSCKELQDLKRGLLLQRL